MKNYSNPSESNENPQKANEVVELEYTKNKKYIDSKQSTKNIQKKKNKFIKEIDELNYDD